MKHILTNSKMAMQTKLRVLNCYVISTLTYGSQSWTISSVMQDRINAAEMWFYRKMLKISWTSHTTNQAVLNRIGKDKTLLKNIQFRQIKFLGHILRKDGLEKNILTGKISGTRSQGRQRQKYMDTISDVTGKDIVSIFHLAENRELWRFMAVNVLKGHGT